MTRLYFVRHALPDKTVQDDMTRPLTVEGRRDSMAVAWALADKDITSIVSSPYKRSVETVTPLAKTLGFEIKTIDDLRERNAGEWLGENFFEFIQKQWEDHNYHIKNGECIAEVQKRNIAAVNRLLSLHDGQNIVIGTHGTALSAILNFYYPQFGFEEFKKIVDFMPFIIRLDFEGETLCGSQVELVIHKNYIG